MRNRLALLTLFSMIAIAGAAGVSAQAQVPAPAGLLSIGTLALAQAPSAGDSSSGSQSSSTQSSTQSSAPSGAATESRHESSTTTTMPVSPLWIAVGVVALVALIALIVSASRRDTGSTTTVVK